MKIYQLLIIAGSVFTVGALPSVAPAQVQKVGGAYLFRAKWTAGEKLSYNMLTSMQSKQMKKPGSMSVTILLKVLSVRHGVAKVQAGVSNMKMNGQAMNTGAKTSIVELNDRNKVVGGSSPSAIGSEWPEKPIKVGHSWTGNAVVPGGQMSVSTTYKFLGIRNVGGKAVAALGLKLSGSTPGKGVMYVSVADGQMVSTTVDISYGVSTKAPMKMHMVVKRP